MNDPYSVVPSEELIPMPHQDRSVGLKVFGILTLLLGVMCGLLVPLMFLGQAMAARIHQAPNDISMLLPAVGMYGGLAMVLVWLGIGSIKAKRWARALMLIFSWSWLVVGVIAVTVMAFVLPRILANPPPNPATGRPALPPGAMEVIMVFTFAFYGVVFIVMPTIWTLFYRSQHVKATCEARHPAPCWTDRRPLPILGLCLWLWISVPMLLLMPIAGRGVMPFFGGFLTGLPGALFALTLALIWAIAAWRIYRLDLRGWWLLLVALCALTMSSVMTFAGHDMLEMYQLMNYPKEQIDQLRQTGLLEGNHLGWLMSLSMLPLFSFLIYIRKFFRPGA